MPAENKYFRLVKELDCDEPHCDVLRKLVDADDAFVAKITLEGQTTPRSILIKPEASIREYVADGEQYGDFMMMVDEAFDELEELI